MKVVYLVHDLGDAAVRRRVRMLQIGGAEVALAGFRRGESAPEAVEGVTPVDLGRTHDARMVQRALSVGRSWADLGRRADLFRGADVIMARNLEMLLLATGARDRFAPDAAVIYEALDIHRLMLSDGAPGKLLRAAERRLAQACDLLVVSSPAFLTHYFEARGQAAGLPSLLIENKPLDDPDRTPPAARIVEPAAGQPWRIGWFGAIRCPKSLAILGELARRLDGAVEVVIRDRPTPALFGDFEGLVARAPHVRFEGPYRNPEDLAAIYGEVHFTWAIDFYEEGQNSSWLLPNRLYEGGLFGSVPLALGSVETGRKLERMGVGVRFGEPLIDQMERFFRDLTQARYAQLRAEAARPPLETWLARPDECRAVVASLAGLRPQAVRSAA